MPSVATRVSPEEYLERERKAETKSEYRNGAIVAMAGASIVHARIISNLMFQIHSALRHGPCEVFSTDLRLAVRAASLFTYPDVMVICGEPELDDDRGEKFAAYRTIPSLTEYLTVSQDKILVEQHTRQPDEPWLRREFRELSATIELKSIGVELRVADVY